ncbi:uncharacterized protein LOC108910509 [Anoplophora glabripennis]|uniref:uncharacterized protein LOC108910509 n=1 Tax=Anoplophora glabripennis TaxID=217634 RepID=UPI000875826A|nr:uncharacterized protein LOC108910509 [Anoplophora glabripennis]
MDRFVTRINRKDDYPPSTSTVSVTEPQQPSISSIPKEQFTHTASTWSIDTVTDTDSLSESQELETLRVKKKKKVYSQRFKEEWLKQFNWLKLLQNGEKLCITCNQTLEGGISHLLRHAKNIRHKKKSQKIVKVANIKLMMEEASVHNRLSVSIKEAEYKLIMGLVVEHNCPMLIMDHIPRLLHSCLTDSGIVKNINCARTKCTQMIHMLKNEAELDITENLKTNKFSIIIDETTDISSKKCLAVLARFIDKKKMMITEQLFSVLEVNDCTANGLTTAIICLLNKHKINPTNIIGLAADNAAVMMGDIGGVQAKLKEKINPNIFVIGCICHSLHLCASMASKKIPSEIEEFVQDIYNYISRSPKRLNIYQEFQAFVELKPHKMLKLSQTRWLSLEAVVVRILEQWSALKLFFTHEVAEEKELQKAINILDKFNNVNVELYLTFLSYIIPHINKMNLEFQSEEPKLYLLYNRISTLYKTILKNFMKSDYIDRAKNIQQVNPLNVHEYLSNKDIYLGQKTELLIRKHYLQMQNLTLFYNNCLNFYVELCLQIRERFKNVDQYENFQLLDPNLLLSKPTSLTPLFEQFPHLLNDNVEEVASECRELCNLPDTIKNNLKILDFTEFWFELYSMKNSLDQNIFANVCEFVFNVLSLPHSSASAERIFSQLSLIKTKLRNRLLPETCNSLLMAKGLLGKTPCFEWKPSQSLLRKDIFYAYK